MYFDPVKCPKTAVIGMMEDQTKEEPRLNSPDIRASCRNMHLTSYFCATYLNNPSVDGLPSADRNID
jgi:hypothetical protein